MKREEEETWRERRIRDEWRGGEEMKKRRWRDGRRGGGEREKIRRLERNISNHFIWCVHKNNALYIVHVFTVPAHDVV